MYKTCQQPDNNERYGLILNNFSTFSMAFHGNEKEKVKCAYVRIPLAPSQIKIKMKEMTKLRRHKAI